MQSEASVQTVGDTLTGAAAADERNVRAANFVFFGGSAGIGLAAATELARRGASILLVGRSRAAGEEAAKFLQREGASSADFLAGDLATVAGVGAVAGSVQAWRPQLHGVMHTAMMAFRTKVVTADGLELAFALQYFARAALNRLLHAALNASGDGRIVHIAGDAPAFFQPDLEDLQFEFRKWGFFKAVLGTHRLGFMHIQEANRRWQGGRVSIAASCVGSTRTKVMADPQMPSIMKLMGRFGARPERSAINAVRLLTRRSVAAAAGAILRKPADFTPQKLALDPLICARLWDFTSEIGRDHGIELPE